MADEYSDTFVTVCEFEILEKELESLFTKPNKSIFVLNGQFSWVEYFNKADQLLFGESVPEWTSIEYKLAKTCDSAKNNRQVYVVNREDDECSGGYDLGIELEFKENATKTFYGTPLTSQEKIINDTIVREIDSRLAGSKDMNIIHERLGVLSDTINKFFKKHSFGDNKKTKQDETPSSFTPTAQ